MDYQSGIKEANCINRHICISHGDCAGCETVEFLEDIEAYDVYVYGGIPARGSRDMQERLQDGE